MSYLNVEYYGEISIHLDKVADCLTAINKLHDKDVVKANTDGRNSYEGVYNQSNEHFDDLEEAFWSWNIFSDDDLTMSGFDPNNVDIVYLSGSYEGKHKKHLILFLKTIAPFVEEIEITGRADNDLHFKFVKEDGELKEMVGRVVYDFVS